MKEKKLVILERAIAALKVISWTKETNDYLTVNDPKALEQVNGVIQDAVELGIKSNHHGINRTIQPTCPNDRRKIAG